MPRSQAVRPRGSRRTATATAVAALALGSLLGSSLQTAVAQPTARASVQTSPATAAVTKAAATKTVVTGVTINGAKRAIKGTNVSRGVNHLVLYKRPLALTTTNEWGVEVRVWNGKISVVTDREKLRKTTGSVVPLGGYVLSGHGTSAEWLRKHARAKLKVTLTTKKVAAPKPATPKPAPSKATKTKTVATSVTINGAKRAIKGTNVSRGVNHLVLYKRPLALTTTNEWGVEVRVWNGKISVVTDREKLRKTTGSVVPLGGYVLSGHGTSAEWLRKHAKAKLKVTLTTKKVATSTPKPPTPKPTTPKPPVSSSSSSAPQGLPSKVRAVYHMMWSNSGSPQLRNLPRQFNVVNLAFLQGSPPRLVGWGSQSEASFIADAKALRARGVRIVASVGGAGGHLDVRNREAFVNGVLAVNKKLPLDGLDWDIEGSTPMPAADVVWISKRLKQLRGQKFAITLAPNGSNIDAYRAIAVQLQKQNALDMIGQQFYDAVVPKEAAKWRIGQLVDAGIPQSKIAVGMMVGPQNTYWTVAECVANVRYLKASFPKIRGGYLWEAGRPGTADWAAKMTPVING